MPVAHKVTWETAVSEAKPKKWWHKVLGYTPVETHLHILEGTVICSEGDSLDAMMKAFHNQIKLTIVNGEDPDFRSHNGIMYVENVRDDMVGKKPKRFRSRG